MRTISTFVIVISLVASSAWAGPLAPGKPAGVRQAQDSSKEWLVLGGIGAVAAGVLIATAGGGHGAPVNQVITVVTTSGTAT
ncbi:MAG TPA: hypothetical protein VLL04_15005 [Rhizomicrobium sp.]|nr:hypothetical protein [Rhizomicrobium sp.]